MALVITGANTLAYDPNVVDASGGFAILAGSNNNDPEALRRLLRLPTFIAECTTTGSETAVIANSICTLPALGVTFPLGSVRPILVRTYSKTVAADGGLTERLFLFRGAATIGTVAAPFQSTGVVTLAAAGPGSVGFAVPITGTTNFGMAQAGVDATAGPFISAWSVAAGTDINAAATLNARHRVEITVLPLVVLAIF